MAAAWRTSVKGLGAAIATVAILVVAGLVGALWLAAKRQEQRAIERRRAIEVSELHRRLATRRFDAGSFGTADPADEPVLPDDPPPSPELDSNHLEAIESKLHELQARIDKLEAQRAFDHDDLETQIGALKQSIAQIDVASLAEASRLLAPFLPTSDEERWKAGLADLDHPERVRLRHDIAVREAFLRANPDSPASVSVLSHLIDDCLTFDGESLADRARLELGPLVGLESWDRDLIEAQIRRHEGDLDSATKICTRVLDSDAPPSAACEASYRLALIAQERGATDEAKRHLQRAIDRGKNDARAAAIVERARSKLDALD